MSTLRVNTIQNQPGTGAPSIDGLAKAWVNFNGTGTVAIRASFNVTSITDNGTGDYTVNFTNALTDASYSISGSASSPGTASGIFIAPITTAPTTNAFRLAVTNTAFNNADFTYVTASVFR
jgi:hypothetical protein